MARFQRYAIYYLPEDAGLAQFGASWLGWDVETGQECRQPPVEGIGTFTEAPAKYGFHGTLKPPFRLAEGATPEQLADAIASFAARTDPVSARALRVDTMGRFVALVPSGDAGSLSDLAFACVSEVDGFRKPPDAAELARRRARRLTPRQSQLLEAWGYPFVADQFRFHMTLTGRTDRATLAVVRNALSDLLPPLPAPFAVTSICLVGERSDGRFQRIHRYALRGCG